MSSKRARENEEVLSFSRLILEKLETDPEFRKMYVSDPGETIQGLFPILKDAKKEDITRMIDNHRVVLDKVFATKPIDVVGNPAVMVLDAVVSAVAAVVVEKVVSYVVEKYIKTEVPNYEAILKKVQKLQPGPE